MRVRPIPPPGSNTSAKQITIAQGWLSGSACWFLTADVLGLAHRINPGLSPGSRGLIDTMNKNFAYHHPLLKSTSERLWQVRLDEIKDPPGSISRVLAGVNSQDL